MTAITFHSLETLTPAVAVVPFVTRVLAFELAHHGLFSSPSAPAAIQLTAHADA